MPGPWDDFAQPPAPQGPWMDFQQQAQQPPQRGVMDQLLGINGPRYQLAPERIVRQLGSEFLGLAQGAGEQPIPLGNYSDEDEALRQANAAAQPGAAFDVVSAINPVSPGIRAGESALGGALRVQRPPVPSAQQLKQVGGELIDQAKNSGFEVPGQTVADWAAQQQQALFDRGIHPVRAGDTFSQLRDIANAPPGSIFTAGNLQSLRESLGGTAQNFNPAFRKDQLAASQSIQGLDSWLKGLPEEGALAGSPSATADLFQRGRGNYAAAMSSNALTGTLDKARTGILERAEGRADASHSGLNLDNTIRQKAESLLEKPKAVSGLSPEAMGALQDVVSGGPARNTARYVGNLLGGGGGLGHALIGGLGAGAAAHEATGNIPLAIAAAAVPMATGTTSRMIANALAKRSLNKADEVIRSQSPLYQEMLANAPSVPQYLTVKQAIARALVPYAFNQVGQGQQ